MEIRKLNNNDRSVLEQFLTEHLESSLFLLSNCRLVSLEYQGETYQGEYYAAFAENGEMLGVLGHFWNGNILLQIPDPAVMESLALYFWKCVTRPVEGVLGESVQARHLLELLHLTDAEFMVNRDEGLYALPLDRLQQQANEDKFQCTVISPSYKSLLMDWLKGYEIEGLNAEDNEALTHRVNQRIERMLTNGDCWLLEVDHKPVSLSGFSAHLSEVVQVGPVWTPPEHRNRGYARALVAMTLEMVRLEGVQQAILFADNPAAVKAYRAIGFQRIGAYRLALLQKPMALYFP